MSEVNLNIHAGRLLFGLSRIGYTTSSAICDIIDNSIRAKASNITVLITKEREDLADSKKIMLSNISLLMMVSEWIKMDFLMRSDWVPVMKIMSSFHYRSLD